MISFSEVSLILLFVWGISYLFIKRYIGTLHIYFFLLFLMVLPGFIFPLDEYLNLDYEPIFNAWYSILFAFLLVIAIIPWFHVDIWLKRNRAFQIDLLQLPKLKVVCLTTILLSVFAIFYSFPYAITAFSMGGAEVRSFIMGNSIYPKTIFTTLAVGIGFLSPLTILLFYISLLSDSLKYFTFPLFLSSFAYIITSSPFLARDGYILLPIIYVILYKVFNQSLSYEKKLLLKRYFFLSFPIILLGILIITIDRFYNDESGEGIKNLLSGTWGYFYQQPYIFNITLQHQVFFRGIGNQFPLLAEIFDFPVYDYTRYRFETMFGTMFASFYSANGWKSLFYATLFYIVSWSIVFKLQIFFNKVFPILLVFTLYLFYAISGLFYYRLSNWSVEFMYIFIIMASFFIPNFLKIKIN